MARKQGSVYCGFFGHSAGRLKAFQDCAELKEIDRYTLSSLVRRIYVYEGRRIEIEFYFMDQYEVMLGLNSHGAGCGPERGA